jgi:hypothetical protein
MSPPVATTVAPRRSATRRTSSGVTRGPNGWKRWTSSASSSSTMSPSSPEVSSTTKGVSGADSAAARWRACPTLHSSTWMP